ncbi:MAG: hypothetical protein U0230_05095 [Polyangiales bacterium]
MPSTHPSYPRFLWAAALSILWSLLGGCGGKDGTPAPAQLGIDSLPASAVLPTLTDAQAQVLCSRWSNVVSVEDIRLGEREGCLMDALQEFPDDIASCEGAFRSCMSYDDGYSGGGGTDDWCTDFTAAMFAGCTVTVAQVQGCTNASVASYEKFVREASCATYVPIGGFEAFAAAREAATSGADQAACQGLSWECDGGSLQGFRSFEYFGSN